MNEIPEVYTTNKFGYEGTEPGSKLSILQKTYAHKLKSLGMWRSLHQHGISIKAFTFARTVNFTGSLTVHYRFEAITRPMGGERDIPTDKGKDFLDVDMETRAY